MCVDDGFVTTQLRNVDIRFTVYVSGSIIHVDFQSKTLANGRQVRLSRDGNCVVLDDGRISLFATLAGLGWEGDVQ